MKKTFFISIFVAAFVLCCAFMPSSTHLEWKTFDEGMKLAKANNKIVLVDVYTDWCGWCKRMDKDTYENAEIVSILNKDFVAVKLNPEQKEKMYTYNGKQMAGPELVNTLAKNSRYGYPVTFFILPKGDVVMQMGYHNPEQFKPVLADMVTRSK